MMELRQESRRTFIDKRTIEYWDGGNTYTVFGIEFNRGGVKKTKVIEVPMESITYSWGFTQEPK